MPVGRLPPRLSRFLSNTLYSESVPAGEETTLDQSPRTTRWLILNRFYFWRWEPAG